jgi:hypothetical protein
LVSGCLALGGCDDGGEVLDFERIGTCPAHVLEGSTKVVHRSSMILPLKALGRSLQAQGAEINKLAGAVAHGADVARERDGGNFSQKI